MHKPRIAYRARDDAAPQAEISVLVNIYRFVLDCHAKKRGRLADEYGPDDAREGQNAWTAKEKYTRP